MNKSNVVEMVEEVSIEEAVNEHTEKINKVIRGFDETRFKEGRRIGFTAGIWVGAGIVVSGLIIGTIIEKK